MKLTSVISTIALFTGVFGATNLTSTNNATAFNVTSLNGTWYVEGVQTSVLTALTALSQVANVTISCPQVFVTPAENSTLNNTLYVQPSLRLDWFNTTSQMQEKTNISLSGLMTLNTTNSTDQAVFNVSFAIPQGVKEIMASDDSLPTFDADAFTAGNVSEPLPNGADYTGFIDVKLGSSNGTAKGILLFKAYNFTIAAGNNATAAGNNTTTSHQKRDDTAEEEDDNDDTDAFYGLLVHENVTAAEPSTTFNETITSLGGNATELSQLNYTCSA
ncbi:hypothetical protein K501DRAFT_335167 [Backusella circina FSU 941]|nr:hypothetical protein K501DRAFT_335167 [Backusella circina FSU 941]